MKTQNNIINELASNITVSSKGHCCWLVKSYATINGEKVSASFSTNNEEDYTGIFDADAYNNHLPTIAEICKERRVNISDAKRIRDEYKMDAANEDNYEPREQRDTRLAERLYDIIADNL